MDIILIIIVVLIVGFLLYKSNNSVENFGGFYRYPYDYYYPQYYNGCVDTLKYGYDCSPYNFFGYPFGMSYGYVPSYDLRDYWWGGFGGWWW